MKGTLTARVSGNLVLARTEAPAKLRHLIRRELTIVVRRPGQPSRTYTLFRESKEMLILPRGYLERLRDLAPVTIIDKRLNLPVLDFHFGGELRPYQARAVEAMKLHGSGVLEALPGSGKTVMGMALIAHWRRPSLILCHTQDLAAQLAENVRRFLGVEPGFVGAGSYTVRPVTVALIQSLNRERLEELSRRFALVLLDEAHHAPARTFTEVLSRLPAAFRYGLTATPERPDGLGPFVEQVIGPIRHRVTPEELEEAGVLVRPRVIYITTGFTYAFADDYASMMNALVRDPARNRLILSHVVAEARQGRRCLVLTERVQHARDLAAAFDQVLPGRGAVATGATSTDGRQEALAGLRSGRLAAVFATKIADEGLDLPELERLFIATPSRAASRVAQRLGRLMRVAPGKAAPVVFDFVDTKVGVLRAQARHRHREVYRHLAASGA